MRIKSAADVEAYFRRSRIPEAYYRSNMQTISDASVIADSRPGVGAVISAYEYGFAKGWRAAMKYQKERKNGL